MDENTSENSNLSKNRNLPNLFPKSTTTLPDIMEDEEFECEGEEFECDEEMKGEEFECNKERDRAVWSAFNQNFQQVQAVLDWNGVLIQQVNENHQSKTHDNMVRNVALIQEINKNISKVTSLYSDLSANLLSACQQQRSRDHRKEKKR